MEYYYIVIKETLGEIIVCMVRARNEDEARNLVGNTFTEGSGCYMTFEIQQHAYIPYIYGRPYVNSKYLDYSARVYVIATGRLRIESLFKYTLNMDKQ